MTLKKLWLSSCLLWPMAAVGCSDDPSGIDGIDDETEAGGETGAVTAHGPVSGGRDETSGTSDAGSGGPLDDGDDTSGPSDATETGGQGDSGPSADDGGPEDSCTIFFEDTCGSCLNTMCCAESEACMGVDICWDCVTTDDAPCVPSPETDALFACAEEMCAGPCDFGTPGGPSPGSGIGSTVEECQGDANFIGDVGGVQPVANNAQVTYSSNQGTNIWIYSRPFIEAVNFTPDDGEWRTRVVLTGSLGGGDYVATAAVARYSTATASYQTLDYTDIAVVVVYEFVGTDDVDDLMCNGRMVGEVQAPFGFGAELVVIPFVAPVLTANFPNAA